MSLVPLPLPNEIHYIITCMLNDKWQHEVDELKKELADTKQLLHHAVKCTDDYFGCCDLYNIVCCDGCYEAFVDYTTKRVLFHCWLCANNYCPNCKIHKCEHEYEYLHGDLISDAKWKHYQDKLKKQLIEAHKTAVLYHNYNHDFVGLDIDKLD